MDPLRLYKMERDASHLLMTAEEIPMWSSSFMAVFHADLPKNDAKFREIVGFDLKLLNWVYKKAPPGYLNPQHVLEACHFLTWYQSERREAWILHHDPETIKEHIRETITKLLEVTPKV